MIPGRRFDQPFSVRLSKLVAKQLTRDQAERKRQQAVAFLDRIGEPERAAEFDGMSVEDYAEHRGFELAANPRRKARKQTMATKSELEEQIDGALQVLNDAYTPEASREELAEAVGNALDILNGEDADDSDDDDSDDEADDEDEDDEEGE